MEEKKTSVRKVIKCPHCGWEYLPGEILYSDQVVGKPVPSSIIRDPIGHIIFEEYESCCEPITEDKYICDNCEKPFVIEIDANFKIKKEEAELDFSSKVVNLW